MDILCVFILFDVLKFFNKKNVLKKIVFLIVLNLWYFDKVNKY